MYYVYLLLCTDSTLYTGITTDLERRLAEHKAGTGARYTKVHGAEKILYSEAHPDRSAASKREAEIKKLSRINKLSLTKGKFNNKISK